MNDQQSFAIYLEAAGGGRPAREMERRFGRAALDAARERWSGALTNPGTTAEDVENALGEPDTREERRLHYALPFRSEYRYTFDFSSPTRQLRTSGFTRVGPAPGRVTPSSNPTQLRETLTAMGATADEVRSWLGDPIRESGWWPWETWEYPNGLTLNLRHLVVEEADPHSGE